MFRLAGHSGEEGGQLNQGIVVAVGQWSKRRSGGWVTKCMENVRDASKDEIVG